MPRLFLSGIAGFLFLLAASGSLAQAQTPGPVEGAWYRAPDDDVNRKALRLAPPSASLSLGSPALAELSAPAPSDFDQLRAAAGQQAIGIHRPLPRGLVLKTDNGMIIPGAWSTLPDGSRVWRLEVRSAGAAALRAHFRNVDLSAGKLWAHDGNPNGEQSFGPYEASRVGGDREFWADTVFGSSMMIEYLPGASTRDSGEVPFEIDLISHVWADLPAFDRPAAASPPSSNRVDLFNPLQPQAPAVDALEPFTPVEQAASCHRDVTCFPDWASTARAVARIIYEKDGGTYTCSGTLLNTRNSSMVPYFLTASHCVLTDSVARTVQAFWFFQTSQCNGNPPSTGSVPRIAGSRHLVSLGNGRGGNGKGDFSLLQLDGVPNNVFFSGWDPSTVPFGTAVTGVHHPSGDYKRISFGRVTADDPFGVGAPNAYAMVQKSNGRVEPGSSGSGLFSAPGRLVGVLSFGPKTGAGQTVCDIEPFFAGYGRFSAFYPDISQYLEDGNNPPPPPPVQEGTLISADTNINFDLPPVTGYIVFNGQFQYRLDVPSTASRLTVTVNTQTANLDVDVAIRHEQPVAVANGDIQFDNGSFGNTGSETLIVDATTNPPLRAGTYYISLLVDGGNRRAMGTLRASLQQAPPPQPPSGVTLTSGVPENFVLPAVSGPTLFSDASAYRIDVQQGAGALEIEVLTDTQGADIDLYVRFGQPPDVVNGEVISDAASLGFTGEELVTLNSQTDPPLRAGTYFIALGLFSTGTIARGTLRAEVAGGGGGPPAGGIPITSGQGRAITLGPVNGASFFTDQIMRINVPAGARRLVIDLTTQPQQADVDLYVRFNDPPELRDGRVVSHFASESLTGNERIEITPQSSPALQAGTYFIGLGLFSTGVRAQTTVTATIDTSSGPGGGVPRLNAGAHGASFLQLAVAPGEILSLFGTDIGPAEFVQPGEDSNGNLFTTFAGVTVLFDGVPAPLFFLSAGQLNVQVPYSVAGQQSTRVVIVFNGQATNVVTIPVIPSSPGIFVFSGEPGRAVVINQNGTINGPGQPARRGDVVVFYATGDGLTNPPTLTGERAPGGPFRRPVLPVSVLIGGEPVTQQQILFAGSAPGFAGLMQINVFIPLNAQVGNNVSLTLIVGSNASQAGVGLTIQ